MNLNSPDSAPSGASAAASTGIPFKPAAASEVGNTGLTAASLVCLGALALCVLALRRWGLRGARPGGGARAVEVVESTRLADRMRVSVLRYRGQELLVAHSDQVATVLARSDERPQEGSST